MANFDIEHLEFYPGCQPKYIAEIGINHNGKLALAHQLIDAAKDAGANIVKFQTHIPEEEMLPSHPLWDVLRSCALTKGQHQSLKDHVEDIGLVFLSTPFSIAAVDFLVDVGVSAFKTGSGELTHLPLQEKIAQLALPTIISTGMNTIAEVERTVRSVIPYNQKLILMNCTSTYPTATADARIYRIDRLYHVMPGLLVGQSDHTPTITTALGAIARGAVLIEKHFTLYKSMDGPDHKVSLVPTEFKQMVEMGNHVWESTIEHKIDYDYIDDYVDGLEKIKVWAEHQMVTAKDVQAGDLVDSSTICFKRTADSNAIPAADFNGIVDSKLKFVRDVAANSVVLRFDIRP